MTLWLLFLLSIFVFVLLFFIFVKYCVWFPQTTFTFHSFAYLHHVVFQCNFFRGCFLPNKPLLKLTNVEQCWNVEQSAKGTKSKSKRCNSAGTWRYRLWNMHSLPFICHHHHYHYDRNNRLCVHSPFRFLCLKIRLNT